MRGLSREAWASVVFAAWMDGESPGGGASDASAATASRASTALKPSAKPMILRRCDATGARYLCAAGRQRQAHRQPATRVVSAPVWIMNGLGGERCPSIRYGHP